MTLMLEVYTANLLGKSLVCFYPLLLQIGSCLLYKIIAKFEIMRTRQCNYIRFSEGCCFNFVHQVNDCRYNSVLADFQAWY